jgi:hypothetical protein
LRRPCFLIVGGIFTTVMLSRVDKGFWASDVGLFRSMDSRIGQGAKIYGWLCSYGGVHSCAHTSLHTYIINMYSICACFPLPTYWGSDLQGTSKPLRTMVAIGSREQ